MHAVAKRKRNAIVTSVVVRRNRSAIVKSVSIKRNRNAIVSMKGTSNKKEYVKYSFLLLVYIPS
ncbi:hypothetical protein QEZ44_09845 [Bacillus cereus]|nr:hypothetical protein [Bacillus cereus]MDH4421749.1 hypothetical protein [Bacillus cereus]